MTALWIMILWTWGLTPLWVNITGTVVLAIRSMCKTIWDLYKVSEEV